MPDKHLHIVSFAIPYPPNYGGVIDVYYKLLALHRVGVKVHLHCFVYKREVSQALEKISHSVHYYPRQTGLLSAINHKPYIVASRKSPELLKNLINDDYPILFEGIHSCYYLDHPLLGKRFKVYRESNIEHHYYINLAKAERNIFKKLYFAQASLKLRFYQRTLVHAQLMLAVSLSDAQYLEAAFPLNNVKYLPSFHPNEDLDIHEGKGDYVLYHGNLSVPENLIAAEYLVKVFAEMPHPFVIAGLNPPETLIRLVRKYAHMQVIANPDDKKMFELIRNAQVNVLVTFQATGLKLKLLNTLYNGRHILVNTPMLNGTGLDDLCSIADTTHELRRISDDLMNSTFNVGLTEMRRQVLQVHYSNLNNAQKLFNLIFSNS